MKSDKKILVAFILNLSFSVFEFIGGIITGSVAISSDAVHDLGDAVGIGISYLLEKTSKKQPDEKYTYGYARYSVIGSVLTTFILLFGSVAVIFNAIRRIIEPSEINYDGMIIFAVAGVAVNFCAAFFTRDGDSLNQKAVNLHMLEDVLGWAVVLAGAVVMRITDCAVIDPVMSIGVSVFILINAVRNLKEAVDLFLEKSPDGISVNELADHISEIDGVIGIHHIHIWSMDGQSNYATMHIVTNSDAHKIKEKIREELREHGISHATLELETENEHCHEKKCIVDSEHSHGHHHHHHH
ncbi:MAG: cation diffusion facilitator family transporter [Acutalibacteraceae bacterium]|nr:cation diffusion facilitator family transporter [Acutalibacteraceae bacterium]